MQILQTLLLTTALSIGLFFSVSFISILAQLHPFHDRLSSTLLIGFPFTFYEEFQVSGSSGPNFGWQRPELLWDCLIMWFISFILVRFYKLKIKGKKEGEN